MKELNPQPEEAYKAREKVVPDSFKRDFFRLIKTLSGKKPGKNKMTVHQVKRGSKRLPTTFMVVGLANSYNKKILMTKSLQESKVKVPVATRSRVFYRDDYEIAKAKDGVFMTYDDQVNCRFEPISGSLNPYHKATERETNEAEGQSKPFHDRLGVNPEVSKKGVLKMAQRLYDEGKY